LPQSAASSTTPTDNELADPPREGADADLRATYRRLDR